MTTTDNSPPHTQSNVKDIIAVSLFSAAMLFLLFIYQGRIGFSLWDEGFLWYGAQRVLLGEVPIRDFMAYDPGRYLWTAAWMSVVGDNGIITLRVAVTLFQWLGLTIGLLLLIRSQSDRNYLWAFIYAIVLLLWMLPRHKLFDISLSIILVASLAKLLDKPTARSYFTSGLILGLIAIFGRNHGMYGAFGGAAAIAYLVYMSNGIKLHRGLTLWISGITVGYLPLRNRSDPHRHNWKCGQR